MEALYILLGWLLGILSPGIVNYVSNHYKKESLERIIVNELGELKRKLALYPLMIYPKYGKLDEKNFNWIKINTSNFKNFTWDDNIKEEFIKQTQDSESIKSFLVNYNQNSKQDSPGFNFKKITLDVINSNLIDFSLLEDNFFKKVLEVKFQINVLNEEIQNVAEYGKMTFDGNISTDNHKIIIDEIERINLRIAEKSILIVEKINIIV